LPMISSAPCRFLAISPSSFGRNEHTSRTTQRGEGQGCSGGEDLDGIGGLLRGDAARDSRRSGGINGRADLQAFRPLQTATLQTRILADPKKPRHSAASDVFHGRPAMAGAASAIAARCATAPTSTCSAPPSTCAVPNACSPDRRGASGTRPGDTKAARQGHFRAPSMPPSADQRGFAEVS
jgi:hypothetical protein